LFAAMPVFVSGCVQTKKLGAGSGAISGRTVSVLSNPAMPMFVGVERINAASKHIVVDLAIELSDIALKAATGTYKRTAQVASPSLDAARIAEDELVARLAARHGTVSAGRLAAPATVNVRSPKKRVAAIVAEARSRDMESLVLDLVPFQYEAVTRGHGLSIGGARVEFAFAARFALIDARSGELLASGTCSNSHSLKLKRVVADGQDLVDRQVMEMGSQCAGEIGRKLLSAP
jgi:hypothetical protein